MKFSEPLLPGTLIRRTNRFIAQVHLSSGETVEAHCPNTGSMMGCNVPGSPVLLSPNRNPKRRTAYTWELIRVKDVWIGINTHRTNGLVREAIEKQAIKDLKGFEKIRAEVALGKQSRIDFLLEGSSGSCYVEVKNVTLVREGIAFFPDAVTLRGQKHLDVLVDAVKKGQRAVVFFAVQRGDARVFSPADAIDPDYGRKLRQSAAKGVEVLAYRARVTPREIFLRKRLPVRFPQT